MDSKRIYILGAGSSIGHSKGVFPSITGFFKAAKQLNLSLKDEFGQILNYAKKVTGRNLLKEESDFDIEAFFTLIEIELERKSSPELLAVRNQLLKLIQRVLIGLDRSIINEKGDYKDLVLTLKQSDTIITFNWDLLLDNALNRERILVARYNNIADKDALTGRYWEFIYHLSALGEMTMTHIAVDVPYHEWETDIGYFLKAHGSIDWFYCSNENCRALHKVFPLLEPTKTHNCSECHEALSSLVIPPVLNKGYRQYPLIRRIWNVAIKEISTANELIIWGYSMPDTDFYAKWLLSQARQSPLSNLVIINPKVIANPNRLGGAFIHRFYDLFRDKIPKEQVYLYESFQDYRNKNDILSKYDLGKLRRDFNRL